MGSGEATTKTAAQEAAKARQESWKAAIYRSALNNCEPSYRIRRIENDGHKYDGKLAVTKECVIDGTLITCVIKVFDDDDESLNQLLAEELREHLDS
jgi:ribosomal protein S7